MRFVILLLSFAVLQAGGQLLPDSTIRKKSLESALALYDRAMEGNLHLYNGSQYTAYQSLKEEHPYYLTDDWATGNIMYDGEWFHDVPMLFDIEKSIVIVSYYFKGIKMQLNQSRVAEFTINDHWFINIKSGDSTKLEAGFYEVLYPGKTTLLASRSKKIIEEISGTELNQYFKETNQYFLQHNKKFEKTGTRQTVLALLNDQKKELKAYIRRNRLFISEKEKSLKQVAEYYDSLQP